MPDDIELLRLRALAKAKADRERGGATGTPTKTAIPPPQSPTGTAQPSSMSLGDVASGAAANLIPSAGKFIEGVAGALSHPMNTIENLGSVLQGANMKAAEAITEPFRQGPVTSELKAQQEPFDRLVKFFGDRYGGVEELKKTIATDPVGFASDVASVLSGGGAVLKGAGGLAEAANLGKTAATLGKVGEVAKTAATFVDPVSAAGKIAGGAVKLPGRIGEEIAGSISGAGRSAIRKAFDTGKDFDNVAGRAEFTQHLRKLVPERNILDDAVEGLHDMMDTRAQKYQQRLAKISKTQTKALDISPVVKEVESQLKKEGIGYNLNKNGEFSDLDFTRSNLRGASEADINQTQKFVDVVNEWGKKAGDRTPVGLDKLKRILDRFYFEDHTNSRMVQAVKNSTREVLNRQVPGYKEMTSDYAKATNELDQIKKSLSLSEQGGQVKNVDTALRKLNSIMRENQEFRSQMAQKLQEAGGHDIQAAVAGQTLSQWTPRTGIGRLTLAGEGLAGIRHPELLPLIPLTSPRILGETAYLLGNIAGRGKQAASLLQPAATTRAAFQASRANPDDFVRSLMPDLRGNQTDPYGRLKQRLQQKNQ